jgi:hypothetical protein
MDRVQSWVATLVQAHSLPPPRSDLFMAAEPLSNDISVFVHKCRQDEV